jgi:hypothetical protein
LHRPVIVDPAMSNADVEGGNGGPPARSTTGIKPPPGRYNASNADGQQHAPVSPFYYDHAGLHERQHHTWLVPLVVLANVAMFIVVMYYNDCPRNGGDCIGRGVLRRFTFQPLKENPLFGPSAAT